MPGVPSEIPFVIMMRALGSSSDKDIAEAISVDKEIQNELEPSFEKAIGIETFDDAILFIGIVWLMVKYKNIVPKKPKTSLTKIFCHT